MELEGNSNSGTSSWDSCSHRSAEWIWDNAPAHRGEAVREYLRTPGLNLRLVNLPGYSPDFLGLGQGGGDREPLPGKQGQGARAGRQPSLVWPTGEERLNVAAAPSCNQGPTPSCATSTLTLNTPEMHV